MPPESSPLSTTSAGLPWKVSWQHCREIHLRYGGRGGRGQRAEDEMGWGGPRQPPSLPQPERVLLALRRYLRAEQKEQRHTLRHYQHVAAMEPEKAQQMSFQVLRLFQLSNTLLPLRPHTSDTFLVPQALFLSLGQPSSLRNPSFVPWDPFQSLGSRIPNPGTLPFLLSLEFLLPFPEPPSCALDPVPVLDSSFSLTLLVCPGTPALCLQILIPLFLDVLFLLLSAKSCP